MLTAKAKRQRKRERPKMKWKRQVEESVKKVGLKIEEAADRTRWREGVRAIAEGMRCIRPQSINQSKFYFRNTHNH